MTARHPFGVFALSVGLGFGVFALSLGFGSGAALAQPSQAPIALPMPDAAPEAARIIGNRGGDGTSLARVRSCKQAPLLSAARPNFIQGIELK